MTIHSLTIQIKGTGPSLVLIHGVAGSLHIWDPIVDELSDHYRVIRMDLLGYGHSPKPHLDYTPQLHVEAIRNTLREKGLMPPYHLVGLSMGVNLALEFAARWPEEVSGFIGIGFPYYPDETAARAGLHGNTWARLTLEHPLLSRLIIPPIWFAGRHGIISAEKFSSIYSPLMAHDTMLNPYYVFRSSLLNCMVHNPQTELLHNSESMDRLFIHGADDAWADYQSVEAALAPYEHSTFELIANIGHNVVVLDPAAATKHILGYLKSHS